MKRLLLIFAVLVALPYAMAFDVTAPENTFNVPSLTTREIDVQVRSTLTDTITINLLNSPSWVSLSTTQLQLNGTPKNLKVIVSPTQEVSENLYKISLIFESVTTKELKKIDVFVDVKKAELVHIERITVTGDLEPLGSATVSVFVKNYKQASVQDVDIYAEIAGPSGKIGAVQKTLPRIDPGQELSAESMIFIEKNAEPGDYMVDARVTYQDEVTRKQQIFSVAEKALVTQAESQSPSLFGSYRTVTLTNDGNKAGDSSYSTSIAKFDSAFFSGDRPDSIAGDVYTWTERNIQPGETRTIRYSIDYTPVFVFILALAAAIWLYFTRFRTVRVRKHILQKKHISEGEEFTVAVEIHNASGKQVDVEVEDFVPAVFDVRDAQGVQSKKKKSNIGSELSWHAKNFKPGETRVFTYKIVPTFGVRGMIRLPRASAIFKSGRKTIESKSLAATIGLSEVPAEEQLWQKFFKLRKK